MNNACSMNLSYGCTTGRQHNSAWRDRPGRRELQSIGAEEVDHPKVLAYVDWYFKKLEAGSDGLEKAFVGTAFVADAELQEASGMGQHAVH
jgi:hypothetical protein